MPEYNIIKADQEHYRRWISPGCLDFPGSVFYHPDFLVAASGILNLDFSPLICFDDKSPVGIANTLAGGKYNVKTAMIPRFFQYYGPVALSSGPGIYKALFKALEHEFDTAVFSLPPEFPLESQPVGWLGENRLTYYLHPDTFDNMHKQSLHSARKQVNKSIKADVVFEVADGFQSSIYKAGFQHQKLKTSMDEKVLAGWVDRLTELGLAETYIAIVDGETAAFRTQLIYGKYAYDWLAGSYPRYLNLGINNFLVLKIGEQLYHKGVSNWDLMGGDIESIGNFKKTFGSIPKQHLQLERDFNLKGNVYRKLLNLKAKFYG
ncbi:MAG: GNAT family N-acetyltransferase [candidate division Zixibacteria bacterium]|nr:GNAT family N-acetyltransferase [candidate division Zixibacteria bacterium]